MEKARRVNPAQFSTLWKTISDDGGGVFHKNPPKRKTCGKRFFAKIPVSGGLPVLIQKTAGFCQKRTAFLVEYSKNEVYILYNSTKNAYLSLHFASFRV